MRAQITTITPTLDLVDPDSFVGWLRKACPVLTPLRQHLSNPFPKRGLISGKLTQRADLSLR
jgi:hypothetical protein